MIGGCLKPPTRQVAVKSRSVSQSSSSMSTREVAFVFHGSKPVRDVIRPVFSTVLSSLLIVYCLWQHWRAWIDVLLKLSLRGKKKKVNGSLHRAHHDRFFDLAVMMGQ